MIKILSISDVITNSSSEVFVIHAKPGCQETANDIIQELLKNICELTQEDIYDIMRFEIADESYVEQDWGYSVEKGDLLIHSTGDNSIPGWLMDFISCINDLKPLRDYMDGYYAKDIPEKHLLRYNYKIGDYELMPVKVNVVQRVHLG